MICFILVDKSLDILFHCHIFNAIIKEESINKIMKEHHNEELYIIHLILIALYYIIIIKFDIQICSI